MSLTKFLRIEFLMLAAAVLGGCGGKANSTDNAQLASATMQPTMADLGLSNATPRKDVDATVTPPLGWTLQPPKSSRQHQHQVWLSHSKNTAYGVIRFSMPLPLGNETALWGFMKEMKRTEGEARLISKQRDPERKALNFIAEGGLYTVRANIQTRGTRGWAIYAGTKRDHEVVPDELQLAEKARDHTMPGVPRER